MDNLLFLISSLRWQDVVDIALVSYILLRFYVLFRGTNAFRVLIGILILWFFQQVAVSMGLVVTSYKSPCTMETDVIDFSKLAMVDSHGPGLKLPPT